jgi:hypothetical protein
MEPFARRPIDRVPVRRPIMAAPQRPPGMTPQPTVPSAKPSILQPPSRPSPGPSMDIRPASQPHVASAPLTPQHPQVPVHHVQTATQVTTPHTSFHPLVQNAAAQRPMQAVSHTPQATPTPAQSQHPHHGTTESHNSKHHKELHAITHSGLVGFITFLVVGGLLLTPVLPGKIWDGAPGNSQSFSTGDQNIDCIGTFGKTTTVLNYDTKIGFPLIYDYATTTNLSATCDGKTQHATGGHTAQFNPLALLTDFAVTVTIAVVAAKIWRKIRSSKD